MKEASHKPLRLIEYKQVRVIRFDRMPLPVEPSPVFVTIVCDNAQVSNAIHETNRLLQQKHYLFENTDPDLVVDQVLLFQALFRYFGTENTPVVPSDAEFSELTKTWDEVLALIHNDSPQADIVISGYSEYDKPDFAYVVISNLLAIYQIKREYDISRASFEVVRKLENDVIYDPAYKDAEVKTLLYLELLSVLGPDHFRSLVKNWSTNYRIQSKKNIQDALACLWPYLERGNQIIWSTYLENVHQQIEKDLGKVFQFSELKQIHTNNAKTKGQWC